jgi:hypothetical protein
MSFKKPAVISALILTLVLGVMMLGGNRSKAAIGGPICNVPTDYATIQGAVNDAGCTTINVAPGTYAENVTIPVTQTGLTLNGAQGGNIDFTTRNANPAGESTVNGVTLTGSVAVFTIDATNVTINGFTIKNSVTVGAAHGIAVRGGGSGASILTNIFDTITTPDIGGNGTAQAIYLTSGGPDAVNIENNEMKNVHSNRSAKGVLVGDNLGTNPSINVQVKGNSIHDIISDTRGAYGVSVANVANVSGLKVVENTINNLTGGGWVHAVGLEGDTPGAIVSDNDISNLNDTTPTVPSDSIAVFFESNPSFATAEVHGNNFNLTAASFGIAVHPAIVGAGSVQGECNWWGNPSGPTSTSNTGGTGAQVSPRVDYTPWLIAPSPDGACIGNVPTTASECKNGGWMTSIRADGSTFKNQGDCVSYTNNGK